MSVNCVQRLCEEMEYCELLDRLPTVADPHERMVSPFIIPAFAYTWWCRKTRIVGHCRMPNILLVHVDFITNLLPHHMVKEFWTLVSILRGCGRENVGPMCDL